jgi:hypothetical protein
VPAPPVICLRTRSIFCCGCELPWMSLLPRWRALFLFPVDMPKHYPEGAVIGRFEHHGQDERQPEHEQRSLQEQPRENRAGGGSNAASQGGHAGGTDAF